MVHGGADVGGRGPFFVVCAKVLMCMDLNYTHTCIVYIFIISGSGSTIIPYCTVRNQSEHITVVSFYDVIGMKYFWFSD